MIKQKLKQLDEKLKGLIELFENSTDQDFDFEYFESSVNKLEENVLDNQDEAFDENLFEEVTKLLKGIKALKRENDFFNPEDELDIMFPNRNDQDFDDDSMSYDSVFGSD